MAQALYAAALLAYSEAISSLDAADLSRCSALTQLLLRLVGKRLLLLRPLRRLPDKSRLVFPDLICVSQLGGRICCLC